MKGSLKSKKFFFKGSLLIGAFNLVCTAASLLVVVIILYATLRGYDATGSSIEGFAYGFLKFLYLKSWIIMIVASLSQVWVLFFVCLFGFKTAIDYLFGLDRVINYLFGGERI